MNILALEPYYGGSHKAFLDGLTKHSHHNWTCLTLPPNKWKWRMRHSAITLSQQVNQLVKNNSNFDIIFATDMLNLSEFCGLVNPSISKLPKIFYFHENQLTYPDRHVKERDFHFSFTNFSSALCADHVWFNSSYNKNSFLSALKPLLKKMPDYRHLETIEQIEEKSSICPQGIRPVGRVEKTGIRPPNILWAARFEHDKNPELFFKAVDILLLKDFKFTISVIGEQFSDSPEIFKTAPQQYKDILKDFGYQPTREMYEKVLSESDIFVSTADHEFFGISAVEAISAGSYPLLPEKLAYPKVLKLNQFQKHTRYFYNGKLNSLVENLTNLLEDAHQSNLTLLPTLSETVEEFYWPNLISTIDSKIENLG